MPVIESRVVEVSLVMENSRGDESLRDFDL
jgi:hypothetical protein